MGEVSRRSSPTDEKPPEAIGPVPLDLASMLSRVGEIGDQLPSTQNYRAAIEDLAVSGSQLGSESVSVATLASSVSELIMTVDSVRSKLNDAGR